MILNTEKVTIEIEETVHDRQNPGSIKEQRKISFLVQDMSSYQTLMFLLEAKNVLLEGVEFEISNDAAGTIVSEIYNRFVIDPVAMIKSLNHENITALAPKLLQNVQFLGEYVSLGRVTLESLGQVFYNWNSIVELIYRIIHHNFLYFLPNAPRSFQELTSLLVNAQEIVSE